MLKDTTYNKIVIKSNEEEKTFVTDFKCSSIGESVVLVFNDLGEVYEWFDKAFDKDTKLEYIKIFAEKSKSIIKVRVVGSINIESNEGAFIYLNV